MLHPRESSVAIPRMPDAPPTLVLVRDLIFATKITGTAQALNRPVKLIRDPAKVAEEPGRRLIVDLNLPNAIPAAASWKLCTGGEVIGFVSHADAAVIADARAAGLDRVVARSEFVQILPDLLAAPAA